MLFSEMLKQWLCMYHLCSQDRKHNYHDVLLFPYTGCLANVLPPWTEDGFQPAFFTHGTNRRLRLGADGGSMLTFRGGRHGWPRATGWELGSSGKLPTCGIPASIELLSVLGLQAIRMRISQLSLVQGLMTFCPEQGDRLRAVRQ